MMKAVLKTLAISFGGGLALGAGIRLTQGAAKPRRESEVDLDPVLSRLHHVESRIVEMESGARREPVMSGPLPAEVDLNPVLSRLQKVENRIVEMESVARPEPAMSGPLPSEVLGKTLMAFEARLAAQVNEVEQLRDGIRRVDQCLADLDTQLPVLVQSTVNVRFEQAEQKLLRDFEDAQSRSMTAFADTLQSKVVERISTLEVNLAEQSQAIGKLRDASARSDENLQKMLVGIERLVDQSRASPPAPVVVTAPPPVPAVVPRESPASVYEAASAIVRKDPVLDPVKVRVYTIGEEPEAPPHTPEPSLVETPVVFSKVEEQVLEETPKPVMASEPPVATAAEKTIASPMPAEDPVMVAPGPVVEPPVASPLPHAEPLPEESYEWVNKIGLELLAPRSKPRLGWRIPLVIGLAAGLILIVGLLYTGMLQHLFESSAAPQASTLASTSPAAEPPAPATAPPPAAKPAEPNVQLEVAREYQRRKDWTKAESCFRTVLDANPNNRDAAIGLSDVLYQEQKYEESAAVLNKLRSAKSE